MASCRAFAPALVCQHADLLTQMLLYLAPSIGLALVLRALAATHPRFFIFTLAGTVCHELAHWCVGLVTGACPGALTVIPRRAGRHWQLGSVTLNRVRWYNAAPAALAPLLVLALPLAVAWWRCVPGWHFEPFDALIALLLAPQFLSFWPSSTDWRIALRSWPALLLAGALAAVFIWRQPALFQFVKA